jgi:hypothetical protein
MSIVSFVGLEASLKMNNIKTFKLKCSHIPMVLFKSIVRDIDIMLVQYGPLIEHKMEEARSQFLSPVSARQLFIWQSKSKFSLRSIIICVHLVWGGWRLDFAFMNFPESLFEGCITTKGRVEYYFKVFGLVAVLFVEFKLKTSSAKERLDAIAQLCNSRM